MTTRPSHGPRPTWGREPIDAQLNPATEPTVRDRLAHLDKAAAHTQARDRARRTGHAMTVWRFGPPGPGRFHVEQHQPGHEHCRGFFARVMPDGTTMPYPENTAKPHGSLGNAPPGPTPDPNPARRASIARRLRERAERIAHANMIDAREDREARRVLGEELPDANPTPDRVGPHLEPTGGLASMPPAPADCTPRPWPPGKLLISG